MQSNSLRGFMSGHDRRAQIFEALPQSRCYPVVCQAFEFVPKLYGRSTADWAAMFLHSRREMLGT